MTKARLAALPPLLRLMAQGLAPAPKCADPLYLSAAWRSLVTTLIRQRGRRCEERGKGCTDDGKGTAKLIGDHTVEVRDGGAELDPRNIRLMCQACHNAKTARARAERMARRYG